MRSVCVGLVATFAACYQPTLQEGAPCGPSDVCPSGQECRAGTCFFTTTPLDASELDATSYKAWQAPVEITSLEIPDATDETDPSISANRLVVVLSAQNGAGDNDIYIGTRTSPTDDFTVTPANTLNSGSDDECPEISADGKTIWFASNRSGQYDIYMSTLFVGTWSPPTTLPALSMHDDSNVAVSPDGLSAVVLDQAAVHHFYLHKRNSTIGAWGVGTMHPELEITDDIASPTITNDAQTIYFHAGSPRDIYVAHRKSDGSFSQPVPVAELNTPQRDACPFVNQSDDYMIFERAGDIFETTR